MDAWYVTVVMNRCPHCHEGELFSGWLKLHETCPVCGARYERWAGSWTGPTVGGYGIGATIGSLLTVFLHFRGLLYDGAEYLIAGVSVLTVLASYRWVKAAWLGLMYDWGYIFPDPKPPASEPKEANET